KLYYETVIQIGNKFDCSVGSIKADLAKRVLNDFMQDFSERNPNLYVFNAVLHMDEATPHLHIDYIPVAHGYQKGLQVRNSLDKALKEQGIDGKATKRGNSTQNWQEREKNELERIMNKYSIERAEDTGINRKHMSIDQYKAVAEQIANEVRYIPEEIEKAPVLLNKERVSVKKSDLEQLEQRARLSVVHENNTKLLEEKTEKNFDDSKIYIAQKMSLALNYLEVAEKKLQEANAEKEKAKELQEKAQKMYKAQEELNVKFKQLYSLYRTKELKVKELTDENTSLKAQICDLTASFDERLQKCTEPLRNRVESLTTQIKSILRAVRYISHTFTGEVGSAFLNATVKASNKFLEKKGFDNIAS
ncbi:plasmid recombination protein, partial [Fusobacterium sp. CM22]